MRKKAQKHIALPPPQIPIDRIPATDSSKALDLKLLLYLNELSLRYGFMRLSFQNDPYCPDTVVYLALPRVMSAGEWNIRWF